MALLKQFERLENIIEMRRENAEFLTMKLRDHEAIIPQQMDTKDIKSTYHLYLLQIDPKKAGGNIQVLKEKLKKKGLTDIPHFAPLYKFQILKQLGYDTEKLEASCPVAEEAFDNRFTHLPHLRTQPRTARIYGRYNPGFCRRDAKRRVGFNRDSIPKK